MVYDYWWLSSYRRERQDMWTSLLSGEQHYRTPQWRFYRCGQERTLLQRYSILAIYIQIQIFEAGIIAKSNPMEMQESQPRQEQDRTQMQGPAQQKTFQNSQFTQKTPLLLWTKEIHQKIRKKEMHIQEIRIPQLIDYSQGLSQMGDLEVILYWSCLMRIHEEIFRRTAKKQRDQLYIRFLVEREFREIVKDKEALPKMTVKELGVYLGGLLKHDNKLQIPRAHLDDVRYQIFLRYKQHHLWNSEDFYPGYIYEYLNYYSPLDMDTNLTYLRVSSKKLSLEQLTLEELQCYSNGLSKFRELLNIPKEHCSKVCQEISAREAKEKVQSKKEESKPSSVLSFLGCFSQKGKAESKGQGKYEPLPLEDEPEGSVEASYSKGGKGMKLE